MPDLRTRIITHVLHMMTLEIVYAREALKHYHAELPWLDLMNGVREQMSKVSNVSN